MSDEDRKDSNMRESFYVRMTRATPSASNVIIKSQHRKEDAAFVAAANPATVLKLLQLIIQQDTLIKQVEALVPQWDTERGLEFYDDGTAQGPEAKRQCAEELWAILKGDEE